MFTLNEALKIAGLPQKLDEENGVRKAIMSDLDKDERSALSAVEKELGKKIGEVSVEEVLSKLSSMYASEIGGSEARYKELVADIKRTYKSNGARGSTR